MKILNKAIALTLCAAAGLSLTACGKSYDGTYKATYDCSDVFADALGGVELDGELNVEFTLTLEKGEYELELDGDTFQANAEEYFSNNMDTIMLASFGASDISEIEDYATMLGYADYDEMKADMLDMMMAEFDSDEMNVTDSGKYTVKGDVIEFDSDDNEDFDGEVNDGKITLVMEDEDDIFGGDVELVFEAEK